MLAIVRRALAEDAAAHDVTTGLLGEAVRQPATAHFIAEAPCDVAGLDVAAAVFRELDAGARAEPGRGPVILTVHATAGALLSGERVALNFLQRLCGVATETRRAVEAVEGTGARITHTRKTTPGLRALEIAAVLAGGGVPNRASASDAVMWKDNHWALLEATLDETIRRAPAGIEVVVEVESESQLEAALAAGVTHVLIDNQSPDTLRAWKRRAGAAVTIQASGGITSANARDYALAGADLIAIGALTHTVRAAAIRCDIAFTAAARTSPR